MINTIILGHALNVLPKLPAESVNCVTCSPPYWGLRDYGVEPVIWDEKECEHEFSISSQSPISHKPGETNPGKEAWYKDKGGIGNPNIRCEHEFNEYDSKLLHENRQNLNGGTLGNPKFRKNLHGFGKAKAGFCSKCGAWRGSLGLEPTFELYVKHLCDIFDEVKRVLRDDGVCFINIGDSYGGSGNASGHKEYTKNLGYKTSEMGASQGNQKTTKGYEKSLLDIPYRFSIEMIDRGWTKRNTIIWYKPNCMPESADDRFTVDFEYLFFFSKSNKTLFWANEKTLECVSKKPSGTKVIEGKDWEWIICPACEGNIKDKICPRCKDSGKVKYSFWSGHDYWFEQQFEGYAPATLGADGQTPHNLSQPRPRKVRGYKSKQMDKETHRQQHHGKDINYGKYGRNKRCVWKISTKSFKEAHFATFPITLIEPIIKAGCPEFVCKKCGKARVKILKSKFTAHNGKIKSKYDPKIKDGGAGRLALLRQAARERGGEYCQELEFLGYSDCGCNAGFESGIVLDPFMGAGTTALVALKQRKRYIGIEIKKEYIDMSYKRIARVQQEIF